MCLDALGKPAEAISVLVESPRETIVEEAKTWGADLIVVGSHGRRGITEFLLGSVSEAVVRHTLESTETKGPAVHILSGHGAGKDGYLSFEQLSNCKIDGTDFAPEFDWYSYEQSSGPYEEPASHQNE